MMRVLALGPLSCRMNDGIAEKAADFAEERGERDGEERLLHHATTRAIIGAFYSVHSRLGAGLFEHVYANAIDVLLRRARLRVEREVPFEIFFGGVVVGRYRADMIVASTVIVEVKAGAGIDPIHTAQVLNYLRASGLSVGLLLHFGRKAEFRRIISTAGAAR